MATIRWLRLSHATHKRQGQQCFLPAKRWHLFTAWTKTPGFAQKFEALNPKQWPKYEFFTGILILSEHDFVLIGSNKSANIYIKCLNCCLAQIFIWISGSYMDYKKGLKINSKGIVEYRPYYCVKYVTIGKSIL